MLNKKVLNAMAEGIRLLETPDIDADSQFECPKCFGSHFGSWGEGIREYFCHDEFNRGCSWHGPASKCLVYSYSQRTLAAELLAAYKRIEELEGK